MKRLLITGASGFVGGHVMHGAAQSGEWDIHATYQSRPFKFPDGELHYLDLADIGSTGTLVQRLNPDAVIHSAAWSNLERCERDPENAAVINLEAVKKIAEACKTSHSRLVFISTDMVFDGKEGRYAETSRTNPINIYGKTKMAAENMVLKGCPGSVTARAALIYGRPFTGSNSFSERILEKTGNRETVPLYTDQFRTPVLVDDLARALLELAVIDFSGIIHLGGPDRIDRYSFGSMLSEISGFDTGLLKPVRMDEMATEAPRPQDASLDSSLAEKRLKTRLSPVREGLQSIYGADTAKGA
jgi:dTDP-4-dehydrorhamnose reductase